MTGMLTSQKPVSDEALQAIVYEMKIFVQQMHKNLFSSLLTELGVSNFILDSVDCDLEAEYNPADSRQDQYENLLQQSQSPIVIYSDEYPEGRT